VDLEPYMVFPLVFYIAHIVLMQCYKYKVSSIPDGEPDCYVYSSHDVVSHGYQ